MPTMKTHELKTWPKAFKSVWNGTKPFDLRRDDRSFRIGDTLRLQEWSPKDELYTGRVIVAEISYILRAGEFPGLQAGFVVMGLVVRSKIQRPSDRQTAFNWAG